MGEKLTVKLIALLRVVLVSHFVYFF